MSGGNDSFNTAIIGAGAAGLATGIFLKQRNPATTVVLLDGATRPGAKILVSGGSRCNVTNRQVTERDFWGGKPAVIRRILRGFTAQETVTFFQSLGVPLHEEHDGKLFPDSGRARDVLNALLQASDAAGVQLRPGCRVTGIEPVSYGFSIETTTGVISAARVVLATGGQSLPKTGSDGAGYELARRLGHTIVPTTPALVPLLLDSSINQSLSGVSHEAELALWVDERIAIRLRGSLLWTHFGLSGPVVLNMSRHWLRAMLEGRAARLTMSFLPGETTATEDARWIDLQASRPKATLANALAGRLPASVATAICEGAGLAATQPLADLTRTGRKELVRHLIEKPLPVSGSRGYNFAEATAGGVLLDEVEPATLESRVCRGLHLVGEILDVDGRIGGFNFQWAWSSGFVAARALNNA